MVVMAHNPVIPMTAVTGKPDRSEISEMLSAYREVGINQFLIYPRSGLEIEYMSDEWMAFCRNCLEVADSLGMKVWLYDEYNWPSGSCKGMVADCEHEDCFPNLIVFDKNGDSYSSRILRKSLGADLLNPEAVERFISLTHEKYWTEFKEYFGRVIPAIFTDEPSFSYTTSSTKGILEANFNDFDHNHFALAWYEGLEEDYAFESGGRCFRKDVIDYLHGKELTELWTAYYKAIGNRFRSTYFETLSKWCEDHGIALTGHLMYEKLYKSVRCNGNPLKALRLFGIPGFDEANSDIDIRAREMEISGLALAQYAGKGKDGEICELYSVGPADLTMSHMRQLMWLCSCFGVNNYLVAVASMDARGNKDKGDWYFNSGRTQPWFDYYREFTVEAAKAAEYSRKEYLPQVLVRVPSSYFMGLDKTPAFEERGKMYLRFLEALISYQLQFFLLDEDEEPSSEIPVLNFGPEGFSIDGEEACFNNIDDYMSAILTKVKRKVVVTDQDGRETRDVMVRVWADGSITLVDLTDNDYSDRILTVNSDDKCASVRLQGHGVFAGRIEDNRPDKHFSTKKVSQALLHNITIKPHSVNTIRCIYTSDNPFYEFYANGKLRNARILIRHDIDSVSALLDGHQIQASNPTEYLPEGFRQLYRMSDPITISQGYHRVEITNGVKDYRYLPSMFISGDFSAGFDETITPGYKKKIISDEMVDVSGILPGYSGIYDIDADIFIPEEDNLSLKLDVNLACVELFMDGSSLGRKAWGPYEWNIPDGLKGKHHIILRVSTSIMPLFGRIEKLDQDQAYASWLRIKPGQHGNKAKTGIFKAEFQKVQKAE